MRDREVVASELQLLAAVRRSSRSIPTTTMASPGRASPDYVAVAKLKALRPSSACRRSGFSVACGHGCGAPGQD
jgi:hypothetical protein